MWTVSNDKFYCYTASNIHWAIFEVASQCQNTPFPDPPQDIALDPQGEVETQFTQHSDTAGGHGGRGRTSIQIKSLGRANTRHLIIGDSCDVMVLCVCIIITNSCLLSFYNKYQKVFVPNARYLRSAYYLINIAKNTRYTIYVSCAMCMTQLASLTTTNDNRQLDR